MSEESQPHTRTSSPGFQCQEDKSPQLLAAKTSRDGLSGRNFWSTKQAVPLKEPTHGLTYSDPHPLSSSTKVAGWKAPVAYREELKCLASRRELGNSFLPDKRADGGLLSPPPTEPQSRQVGALSETPSTQLTLSTPPWRSPGALPHPT